MVLDTRPEQDFLGARLPESVNIPLEKLSARVHELPTAGVRIALVDRDPVRAAAAGEFLRGRGHPVEILPFRAEALTAAGRSKDRLWQPSPFLIKALAAISHGPGAAAMDVACGTGRDAVYLAMEGYAVTAVDILPDALIRAEQLAGHYGVSLRTITQDIERTGRLPAGPYELVSVFRYLHRPLWPALREAVGAGGYVVYETFHERTRETGRSPRSADHLLQTGELARAFSGFDILHAADAVERDGRFFSQLLAQRSDS